MKIGFLPVGHQKKTGYLLFFCNFVASVLLAVGIAHSKDVKLDYTTLAPLESFQECNVCPEMIVLPLGEFLMGGPPGESRLNVHMRDGKFVPVTPDDPYIADFEGPLHKVTIDLPIAMARNELTVGEWEACVDDGGCGDYSPSTSMLAAQAEWLNGQVVAREPKRIEFGDSHPVIRISYADIQNYLGWLNAKVGADVYRLPTEAEWEYAARAGTQTPYAQGYEIDTDQANFLGRATEVMLGERRPGLASRGHPVPVDELEAGNAWGLRHMSGNLFERTISCWTDRHPIWSLSSTHLAKSRNEECIRVVKGGDYSSAMDYSRLGYRGRVRDEHRSKYSGFRLVRTLNLEARK